jgi:hypothetical protein
MSKEEAVLQDEIVKNKIRFKQLAESAKET